MIGTNSVARYLLLVVVAWLGIAGCRGPNEDGVRSRLEGFVTVRPDVDSTREYRGFEVLVASADGRADTLGYATTDSTGFFSMELLAPERGIYPVFFSRRGAVLKQGQIVVAEGDSASLNLRLPDPVRPLIIRSKENAAWLANLNSRAVHNRQLLELIQSGDHSASSQAAMLRQNAQVLWSLAEQFPGTIGAEVAAAESVTMLEGIDDSLVTRRSASLSPESPAYPQVVRVARRSSARLYGLDSSLAVVRRMMNRATEPEVRAAIMAELVVAYVDSNQLDPAVAEAKRLIESHENSDWAAWARDAVYEIENLMPGMAAPAFEAVTWTGGEYVFDPAATGMTLLEFFEPSDETYLRERSLRDTLMSTLGGAVTFVSLSVDPDRDLNEAFFDTRTSGVNAVLPMGLDDPVARAFNVKALPKRFLIRDGVIVGKYTGPAIQSVAEDLIAMASGRPAG